MPVELAARDLEIARAASRRSRAAARRATPRSSGRVDVLADVGVRDELDAGFAQQIDAPLHDPLVELHVRDAVHQQAADAVGPLVDRDLVADLVELGRGGEARRPAADDRDPLAGARLGRLRRDPAFGEAAVDDRVLDVLDRDRRDR